MNGIELSRRFYANVVRPWLDRSWPGLRHDACIIGYGSELLGFDDDMSRDHNWGPRVQLFVSESDFDRVASAIVAGFDADKPASFEGEPTGYRSRPHPPIAAPGFLGTVGHGVEVVTAQAFLRERLGLDTTAPPDAITWLSLPEQRLLELTAGDVFHVGLGELAAIRETFARFPTNITRYKLAAQWRRIAEEQAFVGRTGSVGDEAGSRIIAARLVRDVMRMAFLLEGRYAPYAKWFGTAFSRLNTASTLAPLLDEVLAAADWTRRERCLAEAYLAVARLHEAAGHPLGVEPKIGPYFDRPFTVINAEEIADSLAASIVDPKVRALPILGSIDQISDSTPLLANPRRVRCMMEAGLMSPEGRTES